MSKKDEALKLARNALKCVTGYTSNAVRDKHDELLVIIDDALAEHIPDATKMIPQTPDQIKAFIGSDFVSREHKVSDVEPHEDDLYCLTAHDLLSAFSWWAEQPAQQQEQKLEFVSPGGGYVPAIPRPMPLDWKLVPRKATPEMLKAMDECAQEGYDERLYAGMASSVYMAAWDASPVMGTLPEQPAQQQEPVAAIIFGAKRGFADTPEWAYPTVSQPSKPLTDEQILHRVDTHVGGVNPGNLDNSDWINFARAIEAAHKIGVEK